jgi:hypothetical protein
MVFLCGNIGLRSAYRPRIQPRRSTARMMAQQVTVVYGFSRFR